MMPKVSYNPDDAKHKLVNQVTDRFEDPMTGSSGIAGFIHYYACGLVCSTSDIDEGWSNLNENTIPFPVSDDGYCLTCFPEKANPPSKT
jgi:hypothetical protein